MKAEKFDGTMESAYGKKLETAIAFAGEFTAYESIDEVRAANDLLNDKEIVKTRNTERKAAARQKAMTAALDAAGIEKPTLENDAQLRLRSMHKVLIASGKSDAEARTIAAQLVGAEWEDGE